MMSAFKVSVMVYPRDAAKSLICCTVIASRSDCVYLVGVVLPPEPPPEPPPGVTDFPEYLR